jgi:hypothetical protein
MTLYLSLSVAHCSVGTRGCAVKQPRREADSLPPSSDGAKNERRYTSTSPCTFMVCTGTAFSFYLCRCKLDILFSGVTEWSFCTA